MSNHEIILKENTKYGIKITNLETLTTYVDIDIEFYLD